MRMTKKATRRRGPAPKVFRRLTDAALLGCIRSRGVLYAAPHNVHPNGRPDMAVRLDTQDFFLLLDEVGSEVSLDDGNHAECLEMDGWVESQVFRKFVLCSGGMKNDEEIVLDLMRGYYQVVKQLKCRVHFYCRDVEKENEIARYANEA